MNVRIPAWLSVFSAEGRSFEQICSHMWKIRNGSMAADNILLGRFRTVGIEQIICLINKRWKLPLPYPRYLANTFNRDTSAAGVIDRGDANRRDRTSQISVRFMVLHKSRQPHELAQPFT